MVLFGPHATDAAPLTIDLSQFSCRAPVNATNIKCNACGASASPLEIEVVGTADLPIEIIDVISWIRCPTCGPQKQTAPSKLAQKDTIDYIGSLPAAHS